MPASPTDRGDSATLPGALAPLWPQSHPARPGNRRRWRALLRRQFFAGKLAEDAALVLIHRGRSRFLRGVGYAVLPRIHRWALRTIARLPETDGAPEASRRPRLGVHLRKTFVVDHDSTWAEQYQAEASLIRDFLGESCGTFHHIGSTAVPGLPAKPVIDLAISLPPGDDGRILKRTIAVLERIGYRYLGDRGRRGGHYLEKVCFSVRTHSVQLHSAGSPDLDFCLRFCDRLRTHASMAREYARLKAALAAAIGDDRRIYVWYKSHWIHELMLDDTGERAWADHLVAKAPPSLAKMYLGRRNPDP